jgi:hypothetical protein
LNTKIGKLALGAAVMSGGGMLLVRAMQSVDAKYSQYVQLIIAFWWVVFLVL